VIHQVIKEFALDISCKPGEYLLEPINGKDSLRLAAALEVHVFLQREKLSKTRLFESNSFEGIFDGQIKTAPCYKSQLDLLTEFIAFLRKGVGFWGD
jgi:hypothetical protein